MDILDFKTYHLYTNWLNNAAPVLGHLVESLSCEELVFDPEESVLYPINDKEHHLVLYSEQGIVKTINIPNEVIKTIDKKDIWNCKDFIEWFSKVENERVNQSIANKAGSALIMLCRHLTEEQILELVQIKDKSSKSFSFKLLAMIKDKRG